MHGMHLALRQARRASDASGAGVSWRMPYRILCDFDGTIARGDVTDLLLEAFADPGWRDVEAQWQSGLIGSATCMARQVALMRCSRRALDEVLDRVEIDPGFIDLVAYCQQIGAQLAVVSDGLDYAVARVLRRAGVVDVPIMANRLLFLDEWRCALLSPHATLTCRAAAGTCKCAIADRLAGDEITVLIGDGRSDFCTAGSVDMVFAKGALLAYCRAHAIRHEPFRTLSEIPKLLMACGPRIAVRTRSAGMGVA